MVIIDGTLKSESNGLMLRGPTADDALCAIITGTDSPPIDEYRSEWQGRLRWDNGKATICMEIDLEEAEKLLIAFSGEIGVRPAQIATFLNNIDFIENTIQIVILGERKHPITELMCQIIFSLSLPNRLLNIIEPQSELPIGHPAESKKQLNSEPTAYICIGKTCSSPVTDPAHLRVLLTNRPNDEQSLL